MECTGCTACIDACDEVMAKTKRPAGLIRYDTQVPIQPGQRRQIWRPRAIVYATVVLSSAAALAFAIARMKPVEIEILRAKDSPYTVMEDTVTNHFKVELSNHTDAVHQISFNSHLPGTEIITALRPLPVEPGAIQHADLFLRFPKSLLKNGARSIPVEFHDRDMLTGKERVFSEEVTLVGPFS